MSKPISISEPKKVDPVESREEEQRQIILALNCVSLLNNFANDSLKGANRERIKTHLMNAKDQFNRLIESFNSTP
jgi:hypothetical protein